jgi:hypothetical protein
MEERAKKARKIVFRIEDLSKEMDKVRKADRFTFCANQHGFWVEEKDYRLVEKMKSAFEKIVTEEIQRLEQELAEL